MRVALVVLCISAIGFLLRVLVAFIREGIDLPQTLKFYLARFDPPRRRGIVIQMKPEARESNSRTGTNNRIAL